MNALTLCRLFVACAVLAIDTNGHAQCLPPGEEPVLNSATWTASVDASVQQTGQFPGVITAQINLSSPPTGDACQGQTAGNRWAQLNLTPNFEYAVSYTRDLTTWDWWEPNHDERSDVFYMSAGPQPFTNIDGLGAISCGQTGFSSTLLPSGRVWWWGDNVVHCASGNCFSQPTAPCTIGGAQSFDWQAIGFKQMALRVGLNTGDCAHSHGSFNVRVLPLLIEALDPNPSLLVNGVVNATPQTVANASSTRRGAAADGVTQLILRHEVFGPGSVTFTLDDPQGGPATVAYLGSLHRDGPPAGTSITVQADQPVQGGPWIAYAMYTAPADFFSIAPNASQPCRLLRVRAQSQGDAGAFTATRLLEIRRPPVVLLHGLWSEPATWTWALASPDHPVFPFVNVHNYRPTNASNFIINREQTEVAINDAVRLLRDEQIAATQADVIGHSMGGVLARLYAANYGGMQFYRNENYNAGDIHKFISITAPHKGSPLATMLLRDGPGWGLLRLLLRWAKKPCEEGAVEDLQPSSEVTQWLNLQPVDLAAVNIVADGGTHLVFNPQLIQQLDKEFKIVPKATIQWLPICQEGFEGDDHDTIVTVDSQIGNGESVINVGFVNGAAPGTHSSMPKEARINDMVIDLLNTNIADTNTFGTYGTRQVIAFNPPDIPEGEIVEGLAMLSPLSGSTVAAGGQIPIVLAPQNGFVPSRILVVTSADSEVLETGVFTSALQVPANAVGPMTVFAAAYDEDWNFASTGAVTVNVIPGATLTGISTTPEEIELTRFGPTEALTVTGHYSDDIDRDLTLAATGTTYVSSDPSVATVSVDGVVTSVDFGQTTITATNGAFTADAIVDVTGLPCPADINHDNNVNVTDLLAVISAWGPCVGCAADINGDSSVNVTDMLAVIGAWGPCPTDLLLRSSGNESGCLDAIKWGHYLDVLSTGTPEEIACWNCWAFWHLCRCAGECGEDPPECECEDPFGGS